jgi:hypothetical protein
MAWQRQIRDSYPETAPANVLGDLRLAPVLPIARDLATSVIEKYEWLGTMSGSYFYGLFLPPPTLESFRELENYLAGVTCVGGQECTGSSSPHEPFNIAPDQVLVLSRGAMKPWSPRFANSRLIAQTIKLVHAAVPHAKLLLAYADNEANEVGQLYQATNFIFTGRSKTVRQQYLSPDGRVYDRRIVSTRAKKNERLWSDEQDTMFAAGWRFTADNPKYRYCFVLDRHDTDLVHRVQAMSQPYPKRQAALKAHGA